ncbi:MAG: hypothetical protein M1831_001463 [Alyxoria varia]|nr:MAG: hypothetical protein M1831_001463 [Alyxoria varia]
MMKGAALFTVTLFALAASARQSPANSHQEAARYLAKRQAPNFPAPVDDYLVINSPSGSSVRYKEPGKEGVCETTPGVNSYSGYVDLGPDMHAFFWYFESRRDPENDPVSLWLNGGPGSDSQIGLFQELGPCNISKELESIVNPYSWTNVSNFIFLSQPYGTGFSNKQEQIGSANNISGAFQNASVAPPDGRYPTTVPLEIDTTELAAIAGWEIIQAFYSNLPKLSPSTKSKEFNLWTESYGGHYGPAFFDYFQEQNAKIGSGEREGTHLIMNSLGLINAIIDERIQGPYYPEFAVNNTYGIQAYNDTVYNYAKFAYYMGNGCRDQIDLCEEADRSTDAGKAICTEAGNMCRDNVEGPYYVFGGRGVYDIRHPYDDPTPPPYFEDYLNKADVQQAIGVDLNYTTANSDTYFAFQQTGDFVYGNFIKDLQRILDSGVRVALIYGDADYICNWFGGEEVSLQLNYSQSDEFRATGYTPLMLDGKEYGESRQYGNFSFSRIYEAGHEVPYYQPEISLAIFDRTINGLDVATGERTVTEDYGTEGEAEATHTEPFVPLPPKTAMSSSTAEAVIRFGRRGGSH